MDTRAGGTFTVPGALPAIVTTRGMNDYVVTPDARTMTRTSRTDQHCSPARRLLAHGVGKALASARRRVRPAQLQPVCVAVRAVPARLSS